MKKINVIILLVFAFAQCFISQAQQQIGVGNFNVSPTNNFILVSESTNLLKATLPPLTKTNIVVEPGGDGGNVTNQVVIVLYSNVNVYVMYNIGAGPNRLYLYDNGNPPDEKTGDMIYSGNLVIPEITNWMSVPFNFTVTGIDLTTTNESGETVSVPFTNVVKRDYIIVPRPENDKFKFARKIQASGGLITGTNNYASMEAGEPQHGNVAQVAASVWFTWSPQYSTNVLFDTSGTEFGCVLGIYTGTVLSNLTQNAVAIDNAITGKKALVNLNVTAGTTYRIVIAGKTTNDVGNYRLRIIPGALPDTNKPIVTVETPENGGLFSTNLVLFSGTAMDPGWDASGVAKVMLQVNSLTPVKADGTIQWAKVLDLPPGTNLVKVYAVDYAGNTGAVQNLTVLYLNPTNDWIFNAILLKGYSGKEIAINGRATKDPGEPLHGYNEGGHSIWYKFNSPSNGLLTLSTLGSTFDTLLGVYTNNAPSISTNIDMTNLVSVAQNDDADGKNKYSKLTVPVLKNIDYFIAVDGYGGETGSVVLTYNFEPSSDFYMVNIQQPLGGQVTPSSGFYAAGTEITLTAIPFDDFEFVGWSGSIYSSMNPMKIKVNSDLNLAAQFRVKNFTERFDSAKFNLSGWSTYGDAQWFIQTNEVPPQTTYAVRSGIIKDNQSTSLKLVIVTSSGTGSFDYKVSSEEGWDKLEFRVNSVLIKTFSGETGWQNCRFKLDAGTNTLEWRYVKDSAFSEGLDAAFVANIYLPQQLPVTPETAARLSISLNEKNQARVWIKGQIGRNYLIQVSSNLVDWSSISTNRFETNINEIIVPIDRSIKFIRAIAK
jgi:hypothetical protein